MTPALFATIDFRPVVPAGYVALLGVAAAALVAYISAKAPRSVGAADKVGLFVLRALFFGSLLMLLLNPGRLSRYQPEEEKPAVVWMVDRSKSMAVEDADGRSRLAAASRIAEQHVADRAEGRLTHKVFLFDSRVREVAPSGLDSAAPRSAATNIPGALEDMFRAIPPGVRVPAVFLLSDGIQTVEANRRRALVMASSRRTRIYPVLVGGDVAARDVAVHVLGGRKVSFVGHPVNINVELSHKSLKPRAITVRLLRAAQGRKAPRVVAGKQVETTGTGARTLSFEVKNDKPGFYRYVIETDPLDGEFNRQNNRDQTDVITLNEKIRVLLVEGNPYWETKYLVQLLQKDPSINIKAIFMLARGRAFEVGEIDEAAAQDGKEKNEALSFPETIEELRKYNLVILGQDVRFLIGPRHAALLENFLYDHGGALLFARGKPFSGEFPQLARLEPVVWSDRLTGLSGRLMPTELGLRLPLFQYDLKEPLPETMRRLPKVSPRHQVRRLKSFSEVLAQTTTDTGDQPVPALIVRKMGQGVVATVNAEGLWRWDFMPPRLKQYRRVYPTFWGQLIRWMALRSDFLPGQDISFRSSGVIFRPGQLIQFTVAQRFRGRRLLKPVIRIFRMNEAGGRTKVVQTLVPGRSRSHANIWHAMCFLEQPGSYEARLFDGEKLHEKMTLALTVKPRANETSELSADPAYLQTIARQTGGRLLAANEIGEVIRGLELGQAPAARERKRWRLGWDSPLFLLGAAACAALEWTWRRRRGLQ